MSGICLYCGNEWIPPLSWSSFFTVDLPSCLCPACEALLEPVSGKTCKICNRPLERLDAQFIAGDCCTDCKRWEEDPDWRGLLKENHSLYVYNEFLKEMISQFKFRGDYCIAKAFSGKIARTAKKMDYDLIVPVPLSKERQYERGFNQSEALIIEAGLKPFHALDRIHGEKQSKKSRRERIHLNQVFQVKAEANIRGKKILLVDDIYTTGSTLRHAAKVLIGAGAKSVSSLTLARG